jgi:hypothetical protein
MSMKNWLQTTAIPALILATFVTETQTAHADKVINNPFGEAANAVIGNIGNYSWLMWQRKYGGNQSCKMHALGYGVPENLQVVAGFVGDNIIIVSSPNYKFCNYNWAPLNYNGRYVDLVGNGGDDKLVSGAGDTWHWGGGGNDYSQSYNPNGNQFGEDGNDMIYSGNTGAIGGLYGDAGYDCLQAMSFGALDCGPDGGVVGTAGGPMPPGTVNCGATTDTCMLM